MPTAKYTSSLDIVDNAIFTTAAHERLSILKSQVLERWPGVSEADIETAAGDLRRLAELIATKTTGDLENIRSTLEAFDARFKSDLKAEQSDPLLSEWSHVRDVKDQFRTF